MAGEGSDSMRGGRTKEGKRGRMERRRRKEGRREVMSSTFPFLSLQPLEIHPNEARL